MDTYLRSMRMCYNIVHQYDQNSEVFISFSHGWNIAAGGGWYKVRDMLDFMNLFCKAEGDFFWSLACHSYPAQLGNPCTWDDAQATFSMDTEYVTLKNLEVLDKWVSVPQNQYKGGIRRSVWLEHVLQVMRIRICRIKLLGLLLGGRRSMLWKGLMESNGIVGSIIWVMVLV